MAEDDMTTVMIKDSAGEIVREYSGRVVEQQMNEVKLETRYQGEQKWLGETIINPGDEMLIRFYSDRVYNVIQIFDHETGELKGWHCNFMRSADLGMDTIEAEDLKLSLFIRPTRGIVELGRDEYEALDLSDLMRDSIADAKAALIQYAQESAPPFGGNWPTMRPADRGMAGPEENVAKDPKRSVNPDAPQTAH